MSVTKRSRFKRMLWIAGPLTPVLFIVVLVLVGFGGSQALEYSSTPEFCASCHTMSPHYESWKVSPHAGEATCIECHSDPGALGEMAAHVKGVSMLYKTIAKIEPTLVMSHVVPNTSCEKCHQMDDEEAKGVRVSHKKHLDKGVSCQDCHFGLVHLANEAKPGDERFHQICLTCHDAQQVVLKANGSTSCTACHGDLTKITPADHSADWMGQHGNAAKTGQSCGQCHQADSAGPHGPMINPVLFVPSQKNDACATCHQAPMPHKTPYLLFHGTDARALGGATCATCHSPETTATPQPRHASANFCASCHSNVTMPHEKNWLSVHGQAAGASDNPACTTCHSSANRVNPTANYAANDFCFKCHAGYDMPHTEKFNADHGRLAHKAGISCLVCHSALNPVVSNVPHTANTYCAACHDQYRHPAGWVTEHGPTATESCYFCHSVEKGAKNSCQDCHPGKPGTHGLFHPDRYWFVTHREAARSQGEATCLKCHTGALSCSECHTKR